MKVCLVSHSSGLYGAERCLLETARALRRRNLGVHVLLPGPGPLCEQLTEEGFAYSLALYRPWVSPPGHPVVKRAFRRAFNLAFLPFMAWKVVQTESDVVLSNTVTIAAGAVAARLLRLPHLWFLHEYGSEYGLEFDVGRPLSLAVMRRLGGRFLASSRVVARNYAAALDTSDIEVVYQPVETESDEGPRRVVGAGEPAGDALQLVLVASLQPGKGQEEAIRAVARIAPDLPGVHLTLVGSGNQANERRLRQLVEEVGADRQVTFAGYQSAVHPWISAADIVLVCGRNEGFGRVTVEAMKVGKTVVGARSGGTAELVRDQVTGVLYEPGNVEELSGLLRLLARNAPLRAEIGARARRWAECVFDVDGFADHLNEVVLKAAATGAGDGG